MAMPSPALAEALGDKGRLLAVMGCPTGQLAVREILRPGDDGAAGTEVEYRGLYAGFRLTRIVPTKTWISIIEGEPFDGQAQFPGPFGE